MQILCSPARSPGLTPTKILYKLFENAESLVARDARKRDNDLHHIDIDDSNASSHAKRAKETGCDPH